MLDHLHLILGGGQLAVLVYIGYLMGRLATIIRSLDNRIKLLEDKLL